MFSIPIAARASDGKNGFGGVIITFEEVLDEFDDALVNPTGVALIFRFSIYYSDVAGTLSVVIY